MKVQTMKVYTAEFHYILLEVIKAQTNSQFLIKLPNFKNVEQNLGNLNLYHLLCHLQPWFDMTTRR